jgi:hypothetical protein
VANRTHIARLEIVAISPHCAFEENLSQGSKGRLSSRVRVVLFLVSISDLANLPRTPQGEVDFVQDFSAARRS